MRQEVINVYTFDELSDKAKEKAREWYRSCIDSSDFDSEEEDILQIAQYLGFQKDTKFLWTGFSCQGDGGQLIGRWYANDIDVKALKQHAPVDKVLHAIAAEFEALKQTDDGELTYISIKSSGRYSHEYAVVIDHDDVPEDFDMEAFKLAYQKLCRWAYKQISAHNDWLQSDECVDEQLLCNEYEFMADGKRFT